MMSQEFSVQPPRIATGLIGLFTSDNEAEAIPGDLLEEFSHLASKSGVAIARRWYWRQTGKTITHLARGAFRSAPGFMAAVVVGGFLLHGFLHALPGKVLSEVTDRYLAFWSSHFQAYMWVLNGMMIAHLMASLLVGCIVALAAKGREMVATGTLALVYCGMGGVALGGAVLVWVAAHRPMNVAWLLWAGWDPFAIIMGGLIVRTRRAQGRVCLPKPLGTTGV